MKLTPQTKLEILCAYLPYGVEVQSDKIYEGFRTKLVISNPTNTFANGFTISSALDYEARPILRHPDDMKEDEILTYDQLMFECVLNLSEDNMHRALNYIHSLHIDTFGAIESGWAVRKGTN